jgi:Fis family transcriptional regulator
MTTTHTSAQASAAPISKTMNTQNETIAECVDRNLRDYFAAINGHKAPTGLHERILGEAERPLLIRVMEFVGGNQCKAADVLGINRNTLRKKLRTHGLLD